MKLQQLKEKIYARLPELKEIGTGMMIKEKIKFPNPSVDWHNDTYRLVINSKGDNIITCSRKGIVREFTIDKVQEICPEIQPHHILRCLGTDYAMDGEGRIWKYTILNGMRMYKSKFFKLSNFSIDKLDEETIEWLLTNIK